MENIWFQSALWMVLALLAAMGSLLITISAALFEIIVGAIAGNTVGLPLTPWVNLLAGFGAIVLTFLAGTEIDPAGRQAKLRLEREHRRSWGSSRPISAACCSPATCSAGRGRRRRSPASRCPRPRWRWSTRSWSRPASTGPRLGKIILAACFINDLGTVLALGIVFAHYDLWLRAFRRASTVAALVAPAAVRALVLQARRRTASSEPETKFVALVLLVLGGLARSPASEAVLPAYLVGMALAPSFLSRCASCRTACGIIAFTILTPFYFLKAGSLVEAHARARRGRAHRRLSRHQDGDQVRRHPAADPRHFRFEPREGMYTTLMMSTGLTFGIISALFGLTNHIIDQEQYTILVTAVIGSAVVPTLIAQRWFQPQFEPLEEDA